MCVANDFCKDFWHFLELKIPLGFTSQNQILGMGVKDHFCENGLFLYEQFTLVQEVFMERVQSSRFPIPVLFTDHTQTSQHFTFKGPAENEGGSL